ncbi:MAG TPA: S8 family peptidase [candidate division Zixibacteria bacterium]|nr:S8 family peptidase [candidate division Zixibacteria bacterium]
MKKHLLAFAAMALTLIMVWGCSESPTGSDVVNNDASQAAFNGAERVNLLVVFEKGHRPDAALKAMGGEIKQEFKHVPIVYVSIPSSSRTALSNNPNVLYVEEEMMRDYVTQTLDWGVDRTDAEYVWTNTVYNGSGINVGVLDSGGDMDHPDLTWAGGYSAINDNVNDWEDKVGHGTHCAGIISADNNDIGVVGIAPNVNIYAVQVGGRRLSTLDIIEGIDWVIATHYDADPNNDINVINMSFSGGGSTSEETALIEAYNEGILCIAAAGNDGGAVAAPANYDCVMAIAASTSTDGIAYFSNYGPEIELIAPGYNIYSTYKRGGYTTMSGTSMACPMVVGAAALAWSAHPGYTNVQIRNLLTSTAEDIGLTAYQQGSGLVDAENATLGSTLGDN